ncbi:hypothetical protein EUGRSUZ_A00584 [Eucalyptus grandis]|uniref:Uncharacterized protein n=2 Tax=Eucalyptus grandis TaxID=71139 RepID=A0ACC3M160_EUCGR|nr:hypothetical protein EUGRSUZ_A00584 [Eucalyptus grandis]
MSDLIIRYCFSFFFFFLLLLSSLRRLRQREAGRRRGRPLLVLGEGLPLQSLRRNLTVALYTSSCSYLIVCATIANRWLYYREHCGICRSRKSLVTSHIQSRHEDEVEAALVQGVEGKEGAKANNTSEECGATFKKPAYLRQHMQGHSLELSFAYQGNMKRHLNGIHNDEEPSTSSECKSLKQHVCPEVGCGKVFKFATKLRKHEDSHVKLETVEAFCCECMKYFSNVDYLKDHMRSAHQLVNCDICGTKQLRKNIQRHLLTHEKKNSADSKAFICEVEGCLHIFSTHVKAVHLGVRPFVCGHKDCGKKFAYKHVRDHHGKTGCHMSKFQSRPRGGRKRKCLTIESLLRKRVTLPNELDFLLD